LNTSDVPVLRLKISAYFPSPAWNSSKLLKTSSQIGVFQHISLLQSGILPNL
jgi:hypothetical protein